MQMSGPHIKIRSDLSTCQQVPAIKVNMKFPDPSRHFCSELPTFDDMPYSSTKTEAGVTLLKEVPESLLGSPKMRDPKDKTRYRAPYCS